MAKTVNKKRQYDFTEKEIRNEAIRSTISQGVAIAVTMGIVIMLIMALSPSKASAFFFKQATTQELYEEAAENYSDALRSQEAAQAALWAAENHSNEMEKQLHERQADLAWDKMQDAVQAKDLVEADRLQNVISTLQGLSTVK